MFFAAKGVICESVIVSTKEADIFLVQPSLDPQNWKNPFFLAWWSESKYFIFTALLRKS